MGDGTCAASSATHTCTYVPGTYCYSTGVPDTEVTSDSCTSTNSTNSTETEFDDANCVLTPTSDFGVTPGSCEAIDTAVATCEYVAGNYRVAAPKDATPADNGESCVVVTPPTEEECSTGTFVAAPAPSSSSSTSTSTPTGEASGTSTSTPPP